MAKLKDLKVTIGLSKKGLTKLNADLRRTKSNFRRNFGEIAGMAKNAAFAIGTTLVAAVASVIKAGADMERLEVGFRSITGGAEEAGKMVARLNQFAVTTPFQLDDISRAARQLLAVGTTEDQLTNRLRMLGDVAAASGNQLTDIAAIFAKVQAKGKVELENLNQLAERGIPIFDELRKVTGDANMEFGAGSVSVQEFNAALTAMHEKGGIAEDAMANLSETITGKVTTALDTLKVGLADVSEKSGLLDMASAAVTLFTIRMKRAFGLTESMTKAVTEDTAKMLERYSNVTTASFDDTQKSLENYRNELKVMRLGTAENSEDHAFLTEKIELLDSALQTLNFSLQERIAANEDVTEAIVEQTKVTKDKIVVDREHLKVLADLSEMQRNLASDILAASYSQHTLKGGLKEVTAVAISTKDGLVELGNYAAQQLPGMMQNAFMIIKEGAGNFGDYMIDLLERLIVRLAAMVAAFAALSVLFPGSAAVKGGLGNFMAGGFGVQGFAAGGLVTGPTLAMVGEGSGTTLSNPEVIAPLDKLQQMMGGGGNVTVTGMIRGSDILLSNERSLLDRNRVRGF